MHFLGILAGLVLCDMSRSLHAPVDTVVVQVQQKGVVGAHHVMDQVLLNGAFLTSISQEVDSIIQTLSSDTLLKTLKSVNQTSGLRNHTVLRSRECILEGSQLHWTDRVFFDGKVYLTLDHYDTWTAHVPQAQDLKLLWDQDVQRARTERILLKEGCINLMRELKLSGEQSVPETPLPWFLIPALALLAFIGLITISLFLSKKLGLRHPGGVIGSVIHYHKDMSEIELQRKNDTYRTL